jgi:2-amino-4-deoxychorismate synthase
MMDIQHSKSLPNNANLDELIQNSSFALIEREEIVYIFIGNICDFDTLEEFDKTVQENAKPAVFALPYRMIQERGFEAQGDEPLLGLIAEHIYTCPMDEFRNILPDNPLVLDKDIQASISDAEYAELVLTFQREEIEAGHCSQTTLSRKFEGGLHQFQLDHALSLYRTILFPQGQYMTMLFCDRRKDPVHPHCLIGATPERHLTITQEHALMIPIAGTLRKEDQTTFEERLEKFIHDPKEINELFQVVDEELKMMGRICPEGGTIRGPFLREIGSVIHTEYELYGNRGLEPIDALRLTLHAPTVVGGPMESAARIIAKYEPCSRRYYSGEVGVYLPASTTPSGKAELDCAIALRCAEIFPDGSFAIQAGGGLVRDSDPYNEARESRAKAMGMMAFLLNEPNTDARYLTGTIHQHIAPALHKRNEHLSNFWMENQEQLWKNKVTDQPHLDILIINNEDDFAFMIAHTCRGLGYKADVVDTFEVEPHLLKNKLVIIGPGPGNPNDTKHPRMKKLHALAKYILENKLPCLGICLGHQILAINIGLKVERQISSTQGMQRNVTISDTSHRLGFYNSFSPVMEAHVQHPTELKINTDEQNRIIYMQSPHFEGFQFHPESVMSETGINLIQEALSHIENYAARYQAA